MAIAGPKVMIAAVLVCLAAVACCCPGRLWADAGQADSEAPATEQVLEQVSRQLVRMARLDAAADIACDIEGPARYVSDESLQRPEDVLFDGSVTGQGIFADGDEPLGIRLTFATGQRIQCLQLLYAGQWQEPGIPTVPVVLHTPAGESWQVGVLPPIGAPPPNQPYTQQVVFSEEEQQSGSGWRRLVLTIGGLPEGLGLVEVRVIGHDAALRGVAAVANQLARQPELVTVGALSQIAAAVRARRLADEKSDLRDDVLAQISGLVADMSGVSVVLSIGPTEAGAESVAARVVVHNHSQYLVEQAVVRLRLPPGWGAAPARMVIEQLPAGESIFLPVTLHPGEQSEQQPSAYMYGAYNSQPLYVLAEVRTDEDLPTE